MELLILIILCILGVLLGAIPLLGFLYVFILTIIYLIGGIDLFSFSIILIGVVVGGVAGWGIYFKIKLGWGTRALALWNALFAAVTIVFSLLVLFLTGENGFLGVYMITSVLVTLGVVWKGVVGMNRRCLSLHGKDFCLGKDL